LFRRIANLVGKIFSSRSSAKELPRGEDKAVSRETPPAIPVNFPWWVEIYTTRPHCLYYFGPFDSMEEAKENQSGYIEDLQQEGAEGIKISIKQCKPKELTKEWDS
jgi:hypothetical protein